MARKLGLTNKPSAAGGAKTAKSIAKQQQKYDSKRDAKRAVSSGEAKREGRVESVESVRENLPFTELLDVVLRGCPILLTLRARAQAHTVHFKHGLPFASRGARVRDRAGSQLRTDRASRVFDRGALALVGREPFVASAYVDRVC